MPIAIAYKIEDLLLRSRYMFPSSDRYHRITWIYITASINKIRVIIMIDFQSRFLSLSTIHLKSETSKLRSKFNVPSVQGKVEIK